MSKAAHDPSVMPDWKLDNYRSERGAHAYLHDHETRIHRKWSDKVERRILVRYFEELARERPIGRTLDCPSGFGRMLTLLREHAPEVVEADVSPQMLELNRERHGDLAADYVETSALEIPFADRSFDLVVSIRLSHHLESEEAREAHLRELCRLADRAVILTWFSSTSLKNRLRQFRARFTPKRQKNTIHPARVREIFAEEGFELRRSLPLSRLGSGHRYGMAVRGG